MASALPASDMQSASVQRAAQLLYQAKLAKRAIVRLPGDCEPRTLLDGYAIQTEGIKLAQDHLIGWKVGCISPESQRRARTTEPFSGPILRRDLYETGCDISPDAYFSCAFQVEFAFRLAKDIPLQDAPLTLAQVRGAIGKVVPALEIADSRFIDSSIIDAPGLIADAGKAGAFVIGSTELGLDDIDLVNQDVTLRINGKEVARGSGKEVLGDPTRSLLWLANSMATRGEHLREGQLISSGTCTGSSMGKPGDYAIADYGKLGSIEVRLST